MPILQVRNLLEFSSCLHVAKDLFSYTLATQMVAAVSWSMSPAPEENAKTGLGEKPRNSEVGFGRHGSRVYIGESYNMVSALYGPFKSKAKGPF
ncbi:hypothetical protein E3N88_44889 [Mikania micrantha]|uniref:Uncharacterized protein n=1 Tax=Mikania micrantha TaxID=192012 RepID=A0A5N6LAR3_9ASTR|nr:hypothetical protein E3N88_44889 [Mikania micrantha]